MMLTKSSGSRQMTRMFAAISRLFSVSLFIASLNSNRK